MQEYPAYTIKKLESELTYEQLFMFMDIILERKQRQTRHKSSAGESKTFDYDIEDIAEGKVKDIGFGIEKVVK